MGGICGFVSRRIITLDELSGMCRTLSSRGGFDAGSEIYVPRGEYTVGLADTRLGMTDLSYAGHMPMRSPDGKASIVFDGEILNASELRKELSGYQFHSGSDAEVVLAAFLKWGPEFPLHLSGMFAVVIYDANEEILYLSRDPYGEKPLYYELAEEKRGEELFFGSTLRPILKRPGFSGKMDAEAIRLYFREGFFSDSATPIVGVRALPPGATARFILKEGRLSVNRYANVNTDGTGTMPDEMKNGKASQSVLRNAVRAMIPAEGNIGVVLDGSEASEILALTVRDLVPDRLRTFSPGHADTPYPSPPGTTDFARSHGLAHTQIHFGDKDLLSVIRRLPRIYDLPFASPEGLVCPIMYETIRKEVKILLDPLSLPASPVSEEKPSGLARISSLFRKKREDAEQETENAKPVNISKHLYLTDRSAMACGLEARYPFLTEDIFRGCGRYYPLIPVGAFLRGAVKQQLLDMCSGRLLSSQGLFPMEKVKERVSAFLKNRDAEGPAAEKEIRFCWSYFVFQTWYEEYFGN